MKEGKQCLLNLEEDKLISLFQITNFVHSNSLSCNKWPAEKWLDQDTACQVKNPSSRHSAKKFI